MLDASINDLKNGHEDTLKQNGSTIDTLKRELQGFKTSNEDKQ